MSKLTSKEIELEVQARMEAKYDKAVSLATIKQLISEFQEVIADGLLELRPVQTKLGVFRAHLAAPLENNHYAKGVIPERYLPKFKASKHLRENLRNVEV